MESKFEKGERVFVIDEDCEFFNQAGIVVEIDEDTVCVEFEENSEWFDEDQLRSKLKPSRAKTESLGFARQAEPMNVLKTLSTLAKKTFDKKTQNYIRLGWLDNDLEVTEEGIAAVAEVAFSGETLEELAARKVAEVEKEEEKEKKK